MKKLTYASRCLVICSTLWLALSACGDEATNAEGNSESESNTSANELIISVPNDVLTIQQAMPVDSIPTDDSLFTSLLSGIAVDHAGTVEDSGGRSILWAEGPHASGQTRTAIRHCTADDCVHAVQSIASGTASWNDADGQMLEPLSVGRPVLLRNLMGQNLDDQTRLATSGLSSMGLGSLDENEIPFHDYKNREFLALNTFGDLMGVRLTAVMDAVKAHEGYHEVVELQYVREDDIRDAFRRLDALDALIWLTQGVRQEIQSDWVESRTVGLTVNRGGFGELMMDRNDLEDATNFNIAGGPGLIFLAASQSHSDGTADQPDEGSIWNKLNHTDRILIGVVGHADVADILKGAATFFASFFSGDATLGEALDDANTSLSLTGASLVSNQFDLSGHWLRKPSDIWQDLGFEPSSTKLIVPITAVPKCAGEYQNEDYTQAWAEVTFDGTYFQGERSLELSGASVYVSLQGAVTGFSVGDKIVLEAQGDFDEEYRNFHGFGEGTIQEVETTDEGAVILRFDGRVFATPYENEDRETCSLKDPQMQTTTSELGQLTLTPAAR